MSRSTLIILAFLSVPTLAGLTSAQAEAQTSVQTQAPGTGQPPAGGQADMMHMMALGAHNQLGVLEYCQSNGHIGPETVALQQKMIGMLPPSSTDGLDEAEATGKTGVVSFGGNQTSLEEAAKSQNTTVALLCGKLAAALAQAAKSLP